MWQVQRVDRNFAGSIVTTFSNDDDGSFRFEIEPLGLAQLNLVRGHTAEPPRYGARVDPIFLQLLQRVREHHVSEEARGLSTCISASSESQDTSVSTRAWMCLDSPSAISVSGVISAVSVHILGTERCGRAKSVGEEGSGAALRYQGPTPASRSGGHPVRCRIGGETWMGIISRFHRKPCTRISSISISVLFDLCRTDKQYS